MTESGGNKGQLTALVEAICKDFRGHDEGGNQEAGGMAAGDEDAGATRAAASRAWTARWAVRQNGPHREIPGHAMKSARKHKNRQESSRKRPQTPA